ncbi:hypothetical protein PtA15_7A181 [Puccinia triticina]|uniref:Ribosomal protein S7 domain-containing protein n=1 Tax=Puccinia triticina TaxID=208348 RepID=A0ABY7CN09_9BASI|nr:uncharacterized protein PtA15_7A181 [Puccinia triticina]WAQ86455.1 hypothetical protein PtA15_7A181 [Puccinia triticina]WAR56335.1 hypothetical protein PtB15_7B181 [Puccinia triticina]
MMKGQNNGKMQMAVRIVAPAFEIIHLLTNQNPIQILVDAIDNTGPQEDSTRIGSQGTVPELALVEQVAEAAEAHSGVACNHWAMGGKGVINLAKALIAACEGPSNKTFKFLYELDQPLKAKIEKIALEMYGAQGVSYSKEAKSQIAAYRKQGFGGFLIYMAKTHLSLSHDPKLKGFTFPIRMIKMSAGAGFLYSIVGEM